MHTRKKNFIICLRDRNKHEKSLKKRKKACSKGKSLVYFVAEFINLGGRIDAFNFII